MDCRNITISAGLENSLADHFSHKKTQTKVCNETFWAGMRADTRNFCRSCELCQRFLPKRCILLVSLHTLAIKSEPSFKVAIDLVGPLSSPSAEGHLYILTLNDCATGYREALPIKEVDSICVVETLLTLFLRVDIPREVLNDQITQFTSQIMGELHKLLGVNPSFTTLFHRSSNCRSESLNGSLKISLRK